jgi:2,3-diaminopropionate biosynthesis protein SbnA
MMSLSTITSPADVGSNESSGLAGAIGATPLVRLSRLFPRTRVYAKLEAANPGGSLKVRCAYNMLQQALLSGMLRARGTVVESSSGNLGIALAQVCRHFDLEFVCVVDERAPRHSLALIRALGGRIEVVSPRKGISLLECRLERVRELLTQLPNAYWTNQYENQAAVDGQRALAREVLERLPKLDFLVCAASTCGTLRAFSDELRARGSSTRIIGVDAVGSALRGGREATRLLPGHGCGIQPPLYSDELAWRWCEVTDLESTLACRRLAQREGLLCGASSGAVIHATANERARFPEGSTVVAILADSGSRYLDTVYCDEWVRTHLRPPAGALEATSQGETP